MTRGWQSLLTLTAILALPAVAPAQIDFDAIRSGVAGCPEIAADPDVGNLAAFLCRPADRTVLDAPINQTGNRFWEVRAGSFSPLTRPSLTAAARAKLGEAEYARLLDLLLNAQVLSRSLDAYRLALLAEGNAAEAATILGTPEDVFDANIPALLATRPDRDRFADFRSGLLHSLGARDTVSHYEQAFGETIVANVGGVPLGRDAEGYLVYNATSATNLANPYFLGADGLRDTVDDLPFVSNNERALAAGYVLAAPIAGTSQDRFDATFVSGTQVLSKYTWTAQIDVPSVSNPGSTKRVELYGVYNPIFLAMNGCAALGGTFNASTGTCTRGAEDVTADALGRGCSVIARQSNSLNIGENGDGDCIEMNMSSPGSAARLQFEVIGLLGDLNARPAQATLEPVDLTDLRLVADGGEYNTLPARPRAGGTGNVSFPVSTLAFRRSVDLVTGAPLAPEGTECRIRFSGLDAAAGPNGIAGDGDDAFPSGGSCLLWSVPDSADPDLLRPPADVASTHSVNQSLFHTLCTLSFDADAGFCALDDLNNPRTFGLISNSISGLGLFGSLILGGVETIQPTSPDGHTTVVQRQNIAFLANTFQQIEPLAALDADFQDLGISLRSGQAALLGCGEAYASPCSSMQQSLWISDPAIAAALTRDPALGQSSAGGIDLMNTDASVLKQEFAVVKHRQAGTIVGATTDSSGRLVYLPGVNFSRDGQQAMDVVQAFSRQGVQQNPPEPVFSIEQGDYLPLTPDEVFDLGVVGRAEYQTQAGNLRESDGWVEPMPWTVNQELLDRFGAIVFNADPSNPLDLDSPLNEWNLIDGNGSRDYSNIDGEYCARWMNVNEQDIATPFNLGCTALETVSANLERFNISLEIIGQDRVFDPPESLAELVAMLDGDPSNDGTGDLIAGPDGIFARNQYVLSDDEVDFEVLAASPMSGTSFVTVPEVPGEDPKVTAAQFLDDYDPQASCASAWCYLEVSNVLTDPDDARPGGLSLILAMPIGFSVDVVTLADANDPNSDFTPTGFARKVNLAKLQYFELPALRRLLASRVLAIDGELGTEHVHMSLAQRTQLLGEFGSSAIRGRDMDADLSSDLDRNRDAIWDGQDDYSAAGGPTSDDGILCGGGVPGDKLQDAVQYSPYRADEKPGQAKFLEAFPDGLAPRSPVFCRELNALLGLVGPLAGQSDAFLWHGGEAAPGTDDDADGFPDVVDNCPTIANASQADDDTDGVGDSCDNCTAFPNPRRADTYLSENPWATLTGGQRDDDHDGFGNICDGDFVGTVANVNVADTNQFKASIGDDKRGDMCGTTTVRPCAIFDLDETGDSIDADDSRRYRELIGRPPGPTCVSCPIICEAGELGNCD